MKQYFNAEDPVYMPPKEWILDWSQDLIHKRVSKGEGCQTIARNAASWGFGKGLALGQVMGASQELEECCNQIKDCPILSVEQREQIVAYLRDARTETFDR